MTEAPSGPNRDQAPPTPWSFWLLVALAALYLGWRAVQGVMWLLDQLGG